MPNEDARKVFVINLRNIMDERRITQADIATCLKITPSTVSDWYNGKKYPRVDVMQRLADFFDVPMSALTTAELSNSDNLYTLTPEETTLIRAYRAADTRAREDALHTLLSHPKVQQQENLA